MRELIYDSWNGVMNMNVNPLKHIPDTNVRHMVLQVLAWMWCIVFSMYIGSWFVMGISMVAHALLLAAIVITVSTFEVAKTNPTFLPIVWITELIHERSAASMSNSATEKKNN